MAARKRKTKVTEAQRQHLIAIAKKSAETRVRDAHGHFITASHQPEVGLPGVAGAESVAKTAEEGIKEIFQEIVPPTPKLRQSSPTTNLATFLKFTLPAVILLLAVLAIFE
jgi:hypothetical protein